MPAAVQLEFELVDAPTVYPARIHGAACALFGVGHDGRRSPFSARPPVNDDGRARWRLGWLRPESPTLAARSVTFGDVSNRVVGRCVDEIGFAELAAVDRPRRRARIEFVSPTYFSRGDRDDPLPDPLLTMRSLLDRWDTYAPPEWAVPDELGRALSRTVYLRSMEGRTEDGRVGYRTWQTGFVGSVELGLTRAAGADVATLFTALLRFAELAGVGAQTGHGFGAVRVPPGD